VTFHWPTSSSRCRPAGLSLAMPHQMKMIRHEDTGVNLPVRLGARLRQRLDEALAIRVVLEDRLTPVTTTHDVINRAGALDSHWHSPN
jgi:hypothetical protein